PVLDPAPALTLASPFGDAGPVANGLVRAAHKGDGSGLGSGADAIDAFWSSTIVGGGGQLDSSTAVAESTGGGVGCALFRDMKLNRHGFWTSPTCKHQPFAPLGEPPLPHPL
ncbi:unnamed protein product, partial [Ascophyllum nodosum]